MLQNDMAKYIAELIGTFFLVFTIGCSVHSGSIGAAIGIGMMLMVMIYALGSVSGAHFNPAVTLSIVLAGRSKISPRDAVLYVVFQVIGGVLAGILYWKLAHDAFLLAPVGAHPLRSAVAAEILYSWALCYVVLNVATTKDAPNNYFGLAIGSTVLAAAVAAGPISGCSLNPAVSLGSIAAAYVEHGAKAFHFWVPYVFAPFLGSGLAAVSFYYVRGASEYGHGAQTKTKSIYFPVEAPTAPKEVPRAAAQPSPVLHRKGSRILRRHDSVALNLLDPEVANHNLYCGIRWLTAEDTLDVDASCVKFSQQGTSLGAVYFAVPEDTQNNIVHSGDSVAGDIMETRKTRKADHDNEKISFKLADIHDNVHFLFFVANIFSSGTNSFKDVRDVTVRLVDTTVANKELLRFEKKDIGTGNAVVISMLFRMGGTWYFKAIDESFQIQEHGTYRSLEPQLQRYCLQTREALGAEDA